MHHPRRLDPAQALILVIDVQEKLLPLITADENVLQAATLLVRGARIFKLPVLATEQYPQGIGHTVSALADTLREAEAAFVEKHSFSCCGDDSFVQRLRAADRRQIVVAGIEAHVCVQQTSLDLRAMGREVLVCADAVGSRTQVDYQVALQRLQQAGVAVTTVESVLFELCVQCGTPDFKSLIELVKPDRCPDVRYEPWLC